MSVVARAPSRQHRALWCRPAWTKTVCLSRPAEPPNAHSPHAPTPPPLLPPPVAPWWSSVGSSASGGAGAPSSRRGAPVRLGRAAAPPAAPLRDGVGRAQVDLPPLRRSVLGVGAGASTPVAVVVAVDTARGNPPPALGGLRGRLVEGDVGQGAADADLNGHGVPALVLEERDRQALAPSVVVRVTVGRTAAAGADVLPDGRAV